MVDKKDQQDEFEDDFASDFDENDFEFEGGEDLNTQTSTDSELPPPELPTMPSGKSKSKVPMIAGAVIGVVIVWKAGSLLFGGSDAPAPTVAQNKAAPTAMAAIDSQATESKMASMPTKSEIATVEEEVVNEADDFLAQVRALQEQPLAPTNPSINANAEQSAMENTEAAQNETLAMTNSAPTTLAQVDTSASKTTTDTPASLFDAPIPAKPAQTQAVASMQQPAFDIQPILDKIEEQTAEMDKRMTSIEMTIGQMNQKMEVVQDDVGQLNQDMMRVGQVVRTITKDVRKIGEPMSNQHKTDMAKSDMFASPSFSVHAIIPGRAWLKNREGSTLSITEGDNLEQYGKVLAIDAPNGVVITSSGVAIR